MQPTEALQYLAQLSSDYVRSLPPSAAMPTQAAAQEAINTLAPIVTGPLPADEVPPPEKETGRVLRPVESHTPG